MALSSETPADQSDLDDENQTVQGSGKLLDPTKKSADEIIQQAKKRFKLCEDGEGDNRRLGREDYEFRAGKQWKDQDIADRVTDGRPCLTHNRVPQFIHQITNDQRQNRPSIKVHPTGNGAREEVAKVRQGIIRHVEYRSNADTAYDTATDGAATCGWGFIRVLTEFASHASFDLEFVIRRMRNPFAAYLDPSHQQPDGSDANYGFTWDDYQEDEYRSQFPDTDLAKSRDWQSLASGSSGWISEGSCRVLEYFDKVMVPDELLQLSDGTTVLASEYDEPEENDGDEQSEGELINAEPAPVRPTVVAKRKTKVPRVFWYKINGLEILEQTEWVSKWIPLVPVYGDEYVNPSTGKVIREGIVRNLKDPQRMQNFYYSLEAETIALSPRTPFVGAEGQFEGHEDKWKIANRRSLAYLEYKPTDFNGQLNPPPQRQPYEPPVQAITQARAMSSDDMKSAAGIYDASLGANGAETSGIAIQRRNNQSQTANFHIIDNLTKSIRHIGRILNDAIPRVYDGARIARIIGDEGDQKLVPLNQPFVEKGQTQHYDMSVGEYDVAVDTGPSFTTKRQEGAAAMMELSKSMPVINQAAPDLILRSLDVPGASDMADRVKKTLPPGLADDDGKDGQMPVPPQVQAKMQQMDQMVQQLTQRLHAAMDVIETKKFETDLRRDELASREKIESWKIQADLEKTLATVSSKESIALLEQQISTIKHQLETAVSLSASQSDSQVQAPDPAGGMPAMADRGQPPTGGDSPGLPAPPSSGPSMGQ